MTGRQGFAKNSWHGACTHEEAKRVVGKAQLAAFVPIAQRYNYNGLLNTLHMCDTHRRRQQNIDTQAHTRMEHTACRKHARSHGVSLLREVVIILAGC